MTSVGMFRKLRDLLGIINGVNIEGMVMAKTYRDSLGYELSFTSLYGLSKHKTNPFSTEIFTKALV